MSYLTILAAVLSANLLTIVFTWGLFTYSRHERDGTAGQPHTHKAAAAAIVPLGVAALTIMVALDKTPNWLNTILQ